MLVARFTTKGIVALVFSCVSGILGVAVVAWYGFAGGVEAGAGTGPEVVGKSAGEAKGDAAAGSGGESDGVLADRETVANGAGEIRRDG